MSETGHQVASQPGATGGKGGGAFAVQAPAVSRPTGGGAVRDTGETFAANPVTGSVSLQVAVPTSPGRSGFGPELALRYDSATGNGPFGIGWSLDLPSVSRRTEQGLPRYLDDADTTDPRIDTFVLGAEDLVPELDRDAAGALVLQDGEPVVFDRPRTIAGGRWRVRRYRPRIEGAYSRIERWTNVADAADVHWRTWSTDNVLTVLGLDEESRVFDPADRRRIFRWLVSEQRDDQGEMIWFRYRGEDGRGADLAAAHQRNRGPARDQRRSAERLLTSVLYANRAPLLDAGGRRPVFLTQSQREAADWMFQVVLDYGGHDDHAPDPAGGEEWEHRPDAFSSYRAGFEVRTARRCRRLLMFHHVPDDPAVGRDCLVASLDLDYGPEDRVVSALRSITRASYRRTQGGYDRGSRPPLDLGYSPVAIHTDVLAVDTRAALLPEGVDGARHRFVDLHGVGVAGVLSEEGSAWLYRENLSPLGGDVSLAAPVLVAPRPGLALAEAQLVDLTGDGRPDVATDDGYFPHDERRGWRPFRAFGSRLTRGLSDPHSRLVDLDGDGEPELLVTEDDVLVWHRGLGPDGFGAAQRVSGVMDEDRGPRVVLAEQDLSVSVHLADMSGDGLLDLVRVRRGEVCYWPNLGHGRFGAKVTMDTAPRPDPPGTFEATRVRFADVDGTGAADLVYLHADGVRIYRNEAGNAFAAPVVLPPLPVDDPARIAVVDLLGNGTACLVWSSAMPGDAARPMRCIDLMCGGKPHLLVSVMNNMGAETRIDYVPAARFALLDARAGNPWPSPPAFPVQVVQRVETLDRVAGNRFTTSYAYHRGCFDPFEREFRGFALVEHWDAEELLAIAGRRPAANEDPVHATPPVRTRTWYHTGTLDGGPQPAECYQPGGVAALDAPALPIGVGGDELRDATRALKGTMLRQEIYAEDAGVDPTPDRLARSRTPFTVEMRRPALRRIQPRVGPPSRRGAVIAAPARSSAVYAVDPGEILTCFVERGAEPRVQHACTVAVDDYGTPTREVLVAYGRAVPDGGLPTDWDRARQTATLATAAMSMLTNPIDGLRTSIDTDPGAPGFGAHPDDYRTPVEAERTSFAVTGLPSGLLTATTAAAIFTGAEVPFDGAPAPGAPRRQVLERSRVLYRPDDLGAAEGTPSALLSLGEQQPLALAGERYRLAYTPALLAVLQQRDPTLDPSTVLPQQGCVAGDGEVAAGRFPITDAPGAWWLRSGRAYLSPDPAHSPLQERAYALAHHALPCRIEDAFGAASIVRYDADDLLPVSTTDPLGSTTSAVNDYRVLEATVVTDSNGNETSYAHDVLGRLVGVAVGGKPGERAGDSLTGFTEDPPEAVLRAFLDEPHAHAVALLGRATTRFVHDETAFLRTRDRQTPDPPVVVTLQRETHDAELAAGESTRIALRFAHLDGVGREMQVKVPAEPGALLPGGPTVRRWVATGWTVLNAKGAPVRKYEPFFTGTHRFEAAVEVGVSPVVFYDALGRGVATLFPNGTYQKTVLEAWQRTTYDAADTCTARGLQTGDPATDADVAPLVEAYLAAHPWQGWYAARAGGAMGADEQAAARQAAAHADTPSREVLDVLGRPFLTSVRNRVVSPDHPLDGTESTLHSRSVLDLEGQVLARRDADTSGGDPLGRLVVRSTYDAAGRLLLLDSMEAGSRWSLRDAAGEPVLLWSSRGHRFRTARDRLRRVTQEWVSGAAGERLTKLTVYGERRALAAAHNLRGSGWLELEPSGLSWTDDRDFKGRARSVALRLRSGRSATADWTAVLTAIGEGLVDSVVFMGAAEPELQSETWRRADTQDALDRVLQSAGPWSDAAGATVDVVRTAYNEADLIETVDAWLARPTAPADLLDPATADVHVVTSVEYDAHGRRIRLGRGNRTSTAYSYDPSARMMTRQVTTRDVLSFPADAADPPPAGWPGKEVQSLRLTYDPAGNITRVRDDAQQAIFFRNRRVEPGSAYVYDAIYRLLTATGREHLGQAGASPTPHSSTDAGRTGLTDGAGFAPTDGTAMGGYIERFVYDAVGNLRALQHRGTDPVHAGWTRSHDYAEASRLESGRVSNRLSSTTVDGVTERLSYDEHGNVTVLPGVGTLSWDAEDRLAGAELGPGRGEAAYDYDSDGTRVRVLRTSPDVVEERLHLGAVEVYRRRRGGDLLERRTLAVPGGDGGRVLIEHRTADTAGADRAPARLVRFTVPDAQGSVALELDEAGGLVSYEEYTPYGSTTYQAVRSALDTPKRYRFAGKERDDGTGLSHFGTRYYASWLCRWISTDPAGVDAGISLYVYAAANPVRLHDAAGADWRDDLNWAERAALWVDDRVQESPVARGIVNNLDKRGQALMKAPAAIKEKIEQDGVGGLVVSMGAGVKHLVTDTLDAAGDVGYYGAQVYFEGDDAAKEKLASRSLDIVLNIADVVTLVDGAGAAKSAVVSGGKSVVQGGKALATTVKEGMEVLADGGRLAPATGVMGSGGGTLVATMPKVVLPPVTAAKTAQILKTAETAGSGVTLGKYKVGPHKGMPKPRPTGTESHHGVMSAWMKKHFSKYSSGDAPAVLMPTKAHDATRGIFPQWKKAMAEKMGGVFDWKKVTEAQIRALSEKMFDAAKVPEAVRREYYKQWNAYKKSIAN
ncbi:SpvB/TcaC N-terminal domain-containing protein [Agrococcus sp. DT81.2]|uniref:SpvB/TcaC N-terminal domain-containing protein n=1 Tax=Agrococcus sp. DT81.2 TaxID=3393414 RepID=UPI003CE46744